jgi:gamma-glutamyltranspeptidase/glutathione hydrolase
MGFFRHPVINFRCSLPILVLAILCSLPAVGGNMVQPSHGAKAMVATVHPEASKVGVEIMRQGGNAVDSAVAVGFALAVVYPEAGNIGGGGFMLLRQANGEVHFLDYREKAPAKATANMYLDSQGNVIPNLSTLGYKAIGVPGSVAGMVYAQQHWGKLTLKQVMEPAIQLARDGFVLDYDESRAFHDSDLAKFSESHRIFQRDGDYYRAGETFKQPELAKTLGASPLTLTTFTTARWRANLQPQCKRAAGSSPPTIWRSTR